MGKYLRACSCASLEPTIWLDWSIEDKTTRFSEAKSPSNAPNEESSPEDASEGAAYSEEAGGVSSRQNIFREG
jgi:hypothetical protein